MGKFVNWMGIPSNVAVKRVADSIYSKSRYEATLFRFNMAI